MCFINWLCNMRHPLANIVRCCHFPLGLILGLRCTQLIGLNLTLLSAAYVIQINYKRDTFLQGQCYLVTQLVSWRKWANWPRCQCQNRSAASVPGTGRCLVSVITLCKTSTAKAWKVLRDQGGFFCFKVFSCLFHFTHHKGLTRGPWCIVPTYTVYVNTE